MNDVQEKMIIRKATKVDARQIADRKMVRSVGMRYEMFGKQLMDN